MVQANTKACRKKHKMESLNKIKGFQRVLQIDVGLGYHIWKKRITTYTLMLLIMKKIEQHQHVNKAKEQTGIH